MLPSTGYRAAILCGILQGLYIGRTEIRKVPFRKDAGDIRAMDTSQPLTSKKGFSLGIPTEAFGLKVEPTKQWDFNPAQVKA